MKKLGILFVILLILLGGYFLLRWYSQPDEFVPPSDFKISEWTQDNIDEIRLVFEDDMQLVVKELGGKWLVNDKLADSSRLSELFKAFEETEIASRVSTNSQNHSRFEVDEKGIELSLVADNEVVQQIVVGKSAGGNSAYVRIPEQDDVYVINNFPKHLLVSDLSIWRDRDIVVAESTDIRMVSYESGGSTWKVNKTSEGWMIQLNSNLPVLVDSAKVESWLTSVAGLQASGFLEEDQKAGWQRGGVTIETGTIEEFSGQEELGVYSSSEEAQVEIVNGDMRFLVIATTVDSILQTYSELVERLKIEEKVEENPGIEI